MIVTISCLTLAHKASVTHALDIHGYRSFRYKVVSIQVVSVQIEVDSIHTLSRFDPLEVVSIQSEQLANF